MPKKAKSESNAAATPAITLSDLRPAEGATREKLRVGRGRATGAGKTCNRGHNGEGQRSGRSAKRGFEGGQMPGYRKLPKIDGFELVNPRRWLELNVRDLEEILLPEEDELTFALLKARGLMKVWMDGVRILGNGDCKRKLTVHASYATPGALSKIEAAGGKVVIETCEKTKAG